MSEFIFLVPWEECVESLHYTLLWYIICLIYVYYDNNNNYNNNGHTSIEIINSKKAETVWDEYR